MSKELGELKEMLGTAVKGLKESQAKVEAEAKLSGEASADAIKRAETAEATVKELAENLKEFQTKFDEYRAEAERLPGGAEAQKQLTHGEKFVNSEAFKRMIGSGEFKSAPVQVGSFFTKSTISTSEVGGSLVENDRQPGLVIPPDRQLRLRDLLSVSTTDSNAIEYVRETGYHPLRQVLEGATLTTDTTITVDNAQGFYAGQSIMVGSTAATVSSVDYDTNVITLGAQIGAVVADGAYVTAVFFGATSELSLKPTAGVEYDLQTESVKTLAHWTPASRQILADARQLRARIDNRLMFGLKQNEEEHILYGDGSSKMLAGILNDADRQTYAWSAGSTGDSKIDAIRRAITLAQLADYPVSGIVMHPSDWEDVVLAKGSDGHYIWVDVTSNQVQRMWAVPVVLTTAIQAGEALAGAFGLGATLYDREMASIRVAEEHADFFARNMVAILAEERLALTVERPEAFIHVTFDNAPA